MVSDRSKTGTCGAHTILNTKKSQWNESLRGPAQLSLLWRVSEGGILPIEKSGDESPVLSSAGLKEATLEEAFGRFSKYSAGWHRVCDSSPQNSHMPAT